MDRREGFQTIREYCREICSEHDCDLQITRNNRRGKVYFEMIPKGHAYGPRIAASETDLKDPQFVKLFTSTPELHIKEIESITAED